MHDELLHGGVGGEQPREPGPHGDEDQTEDGRLHAAPAEGPPHDGPRPGRLARAEPVADEGLAGDGQRVEGEGEEGVQRVRHLVGGQRQRAEPGGDDGRRREREPQGGGAQHQPTAGRGGRAHAAQARTQPKVEAPAAADDDRHEHDARQPLSGGRGGRRAGDAQAEAVDEQGVQTDVRHVDADRHGHRRAGVLQAAQQPGRGEHDELEGQSGRDDPQIGDGRGGDVGGRPVPADDRRGEPDEQRREDDAECPAQGHAVAPGLMGGPVAPGADAVGDDAGRRVGQEDAQARDDAQHVAAQPQPGQRHGADVADEGGVGHDEQRLGDERGEGGQGQRQQVTVGSRPQGHGQAGYPAPGPAAGRR